MKFLEAQVAALAAKLPEGSRRVLYTERTLGFLLPHAKIVAMQAISLRKEMEPFSDWWIMGLNGEMVAKNGNIDPFRHWMNEFFQVSPPKRKLNSNAIPLTERRPRNMTPTSVQPGSYRPR
ncbi:MAG TPA: hypothetical protein VMH86_01475 [Rhizomicrobium sp.]|nr:hypothetical protein [Rhizomicrobium sp.]